VYKRSFSCKINCTKVKSTAAKLHKSPDETDAGPGVGVYFKLETPTRTPHARLTSVKSMN